ncbi:LysR family transcriptional regulator [Bradyrhizobium archetypum]|uniref:LysR family transcriptional regulator n=1 Tax=Bradyrhizobium archetypum TaxID=2721160 RepID=A0A7Y4HBW7_9BRAD|nr:LysR family transcriptional regulator [Bradyrhizobium archetypum]NOJ50457.1 LysR family transcriptional regulator [Bradyrhizobium archetypum]
MRIDEISVFVQVLEAGSFTSAARRLRMPASTVSAKVAALERRLGVSLIQRTTRKLRITPAGQIFFERCRIGLREIEAAEAAVTAEAGGLTGLLRLTAAVDIAQSLLPPIISAFREAFPTVKVELIVTDRIVDMIAEGIDLAIRVGPLRDSSLMTRSFVTGPSGLFASQHYLNRRGVPAYVDDLKHHDLIGFGKPWAQPLPMLMRNRKVSVDLSGGLTCDDLLTIRTFVAMGLGIGFLPAFLADQLRLVRVLPDLRSPLTGLYFAYPAQKFVAARVRKFITFALSSVKRLHLHP